MLVDVHTHLTHARFIDDVDQVVERAIKQGLGAIVVNGLEPTSNRQILEMAKKWSVIKPALGIYPLDAVNAELPEDFPHRISRFDVEEEIHFIRKMASEKKLIAVGECGLDGHYVGEEFFSKQEYVFESLIEIAKQNDIPAIIHSRKRERRVAEILRHHQVIKADFHCFGGKSQWAVDWAEKDGWSFSIPANAPNNPSFQKMLVNLPEENILTETDAPYLAPVRGERNEPANVKGTVELLATLRGWSYDEAKNKVFVNYQKLFCES